MESAEIRNSWAMCDLGPRATSGYPNTPTSQTSHPQNEADFPSGSAPPCPVRDIGTGLFEQIPQYALRNPLKKTPLKKK